MDIVAISVLWASVKIDINRVFFDMTKVAVLEIDGCMASSAAITHDVLATANRIGAAKGTPPFKVTTVRCGSRRSSADLRGIELVIVPGLGTPSAGELEAKLKSPMCRRAVDMLSRAHARGAMLAASCASTFLLAETGLLDGRRATTTWWFAPLFRQRYPEVELLTEQMVVADWPIATGGAAMAQMDLMLAVVGRFAGPSLATACANYLLLDGRRSQAPFMAINYLASQDPKIAKAEKWVRDNIKTYGGDPMRIYLMGSSVGANHLAAYVAFSEYHTAPGSGLAGAILLSGTPFDLSVFPDMANFKAYFGEDASKYAALSPQPALLKSSVPLMVVWAGLDPPGILEVRTLMRAVAAEGAHRSRSKAEVLSARPTTPRKPAKETRNGQRQFGLGSRRRSAGKSRRGR